MGNNRNKRHYRALSLLTAAALSAMAPIQALAENPDFAHDAATWERLRDQVMEYDELAMLVEEYNPNYQNEQASYNDTKSDDDARAIRADAKDSAEDLFNSAEDLREQAEDYRDQAEDMSDMAEELAALDPAAAAQMQAAAGAMMAGYAPMMSAAAMTRNSALSTSISADSSYVDSEMRKIQHIKNQKGLIVSAQNLFNSYNQLRLTVDQIQKNVELTEAMERTTQARASVGMATQADVLKAQKNLQSIRSTQTETLSSLETLRQNLCMMTGWSYDAQPEIRSVPQADLTKIDQMNLEEDKKQALENNYDLKYSKRARDNMDENSTDRKNQERTIQNLEQTINASMTNLYNDVQQKKIAYQLAQAELQTEAQTMAAVETKRGLGMVSDLEYIQEQSTYLGKQIGEQNANMALFQSIETYHWAVSGYLNTSGS